MYTLKKKDGTDLNLSFSSFFIARACKLSEKTLQQTIRFLVGHSETEGEAVAGGVLDDMEARAIVLAAGADAYEKRSYRDKDDGFALMDELESGLTDPVWVDVLNGVVAAIIPDYGKKKTAVKKPAPKKTTKK